MAAGRLLSVSKGCPDCAARLAKMRERGRLGGIARRLELDDRALVASFQRELVLNTKRRYPLSVHAIARALAQEFGGCSYKTVLGRVKAAGLL